MVFSLNRSEVCTSTYGFRRLQNPQVRQSTSLQNSKICNLVRVGTYYYFTYLRLACHLQKIRIVWNVKVVRIRIIQVMKIRVDCPVNWGNEVRYKQFGKGMDKGELQD